MRTTLTALVAAVFMSAPAAAAETIVFAGPGGAWQKIMEPLVIAPFEAECGCEVLYQPGSSNQNLAKIIATRGNPDIDVMYSGDLQQIQGAAMGLFEPLDKALIPNLQNVWPNLVEPQGINVFTNVIGGGFAYNTEVFEREGIAPPRSVRDLLKPELKGHVAVEGASSNYGIGMLILMAEVEGGGVDNIDPGFDFAKKLAPSVVVFAQNTTDTTRALQQESAWIAWWGDTRARTLADTGFPLKWVPAEEGIPPIVMGASVVAGTKNADIGFKLINHLLSDEVQEIMARELNLGPTVKTVELDPAVADRVISGPDEVSKLMTIDWLTVAEQKADWIDRWNREVQGQ